MTSFCNFNVLSYFPTIVISFTKTPVGEEIDQYLAIFDQLILELHSRYTTVCPQRVRFVLDFAPDIALSVEMMKKQSDWMKGTRQEILQQITESSTIIVHNTVHRFFINMVFTVCPTKTPVYFVSSREEVEQMYGFKFSL
jgi:hypothetical protein